MMQRQEILDQAKRVGVTRKSATKAIRAMCLSCVGTSFEVEKCECANCPLWAFRFGFDPWREVAPPTEAQRESGRRLAAISRERAT